MSHILTFALHEVGGRSYQEDALFPLPGTATAAGTVFIVCDGVGGHSKGEEASRIVAAVVGKTLQGNPFIKEKDIEAALLKAVKALQEYVQKDPGAANMSTTLTLAAFRNDGTVLLCWCGDSRIMHIRNGETIYTTSDHSLVMQLVKQGAITEEEATTHPRRNVILRSVNPASDATSLEYHVIRDIKKGDFILLCTDGVLENLNKRTAHTILGKQGVPIDNNYLRAAFHTLCHGKTKDNYSMYIIQAGPGSAEKAALPVNLMQPKIWLILISLLLLAGFAYFFLKDTTNSAEKNKNTPATQVSVAEHTGPSFRGGPVAWQQFLQKNISYPEKAIQNKTQGRVTILSRLDENGKVIQCMPVSAVGSGLEEELMRVIKLAEWIPATQAKKNVPDTMSITHEFVLPANKSNVTGIRAKLK